MPAKPLVSFGGNVSTTSAPHSGTRPGRTIEEAPKPTAIAPLRESTAIERSMKPSTKLAFPILPASSQLGALLGVLFGNMLTQAGAAGATRDAAIGAAAYATAEQQLADRLKAVQEPSLFGGTFGGRPLVPAPLPRHGSLTL